MPAFQAVDVKGSRQAWNYFWRLELDVAVLDVKAYAAIVWASTFVIGRASGRQVDVNCAVGSGRHRAVGSGRPRATGSGRPRAEFQVVLSSVGPTARGILVTLGPMKQFEEIGFIVATIMAREVNVRVLGSIEAALENTRFCLVDRNSFAYVS